MLCAVFRLARYNVLTDDRSPDEDLLRLPDDARPAALIVIWMLRPAQVRPDDRAVRRRRSCSRPHLQTPLVGVEILPDRARRPFGYLMASPPADAEGRHDEEQARQRGPVDARRDRLRLRLRDALPGDLLRDADGLEPHLLDLGPGVADGRARCIRRRCSPSAPTAASSCGRKKTSSTSCSTNRRCSRRVGRQASDPQRRRRARVRDRAREQRRRAGAACARDRADVGCVRARPVAPPATS